jgi:membrane-anchored protein YejM (alkaline phosphatase superfamily)
VILIVTESLRRDVFAEELMPRLTRWAQGGMVAAAHGPGTIFSQAAAFALLYGRSPAVYHQTLDAHVPPQFCVTLRASGYECDYFTGHPKVWLRREEFLNPQTMDHFVHDDRGTWPEWDKRALDNMVNTVATSAKPVFAIVLLMSTHFEYQYPPEYEIDRPVAHSAWLVTDSTTLGPEAQIPHRNRYRNSVRFIDDAVADAIARLDPQRNLVIFTGDHGESLYDDGHYAHGYGFSEIVTKTPFAMVGPGVVPSRVERETEHVDVLPTVLHVLTGQHQTLEHVHGIDWLSGETRDSFLETYSTDRGGIIRAQLRSDGLFLRMDMEVAAPRLTLLGFEDAYGNLLPTPTIAPHMVEHLASAFDEQLGLLRR